MKTGATDVGQNHIDFVNLGIADLKRKIKEFFKINYENFDDFGNSLGHSFMLKHRFFRCPSTYYSNWYSLTKRPKHGRKILNENEKRILTIEVAVAICILSRETISKTEYVNKIIAMVESSVGFQLDSKKAQCTLMLEVLFRYIEQYNLKDWHTENNNVHNLTYKFLAMLNS